MTTTEQRSAALDAANQIRIQRAIMRLRIGAGEIKASRVLDEFPECIHGASVYHFLGYIPKKIGGKKRNDARASATVFWLIRKAAVPGHKGLGQLTPAQLERLTRVVREYEESRHPAERGLA
jgi:hypothetical protein